MPVTVIVGGQFGSEGKGKVAHYFAKYKKARIAIRVGGVNSGHTVWEATQSFIFRQLPAAALNKNTICVIGAGSYILPDLLHQEIAMVQLTSDRLYIDPNAMIVSSEDILAEQTSNLRSIGSTLSGTGKAVQKRIERSDKVKLAKDELSLRDYIKPTIPFLREQLDKGEHILVEGTQGFGLSLLHSPYYPFVTSRDTTAAAFLSEAGLSPLDVNQIILVIRSFPIRVSGTSGLLHNEIDWDTITRRSGSKVPIIEYTSVTKAVRRVGLFEPEIVKQAIMVNRPTKIIMNHLDYIDSTSNSITNKMLDYVEKIESTIDHAISYVGISPNQILKIG